MKICFIVYCNLYLTPYIENYLNVFTNEDCDIICWNRHGIEESRVGCQVISFNKSSKDNHDSKLKKILGYIQFSSFVKQRLSKYNYDLVICLQSIGGVCNVRVLLKHYKKKYIIDIRDYSIEGIPIIRNIEYKLLKNSCMNVISSNGYKHFLPKDCHYQLVHNYTDIDCEIRKRIISRERKPPYALSYIGLIRFQEQNKRIIDLFANDNRFTINFIGKNALELQSYVTERNIKNVNLVDQFPPEQTLNYYAQTDAILNIYGNHTPLLDYALSNKLYYAAALHIPILVSKDTYMEKISIESGFGIAIEFGDSNIKDKLYKYIVGTNQDDFAKQCDSFITKVNNDNILFSKALYNIEEVWKKYEDCSR